MYITQVISHLRGWSLLNGKYHAIFDELTKLLAFIELQPVDNRIPRKRQYDWQKFNYDVRSTLTHTQWELPHPYEVIDARKDGVAIDIWVGRIQNYFSRMFLTFPSMMKNEDTNLFVFLVPEKSLAQVGAASVEQVYCDLSKVSPLSLNYPFVVLGFGTEAKETIVHELTSDVDFFLINSVGCTLSQLCSSGENQFCEFKKSLPKNDVIAKEVGAFANIPNGGLVLLGVSDEKEVLGISASESDELQQRLTNIIRDICKPVPEFSFMQFDISEGNVLLILRVNELAEKPCMTLDKVPIRVGATVRWANCLEIRKMILA